MLAKIEISQRLIKFRKLVAYHPVDTAEVHSLTVRPIFEIIDSYETRNFTYYHTVTTSVLA